MDTALVLFLILINGLFAMSEMALTASRKARLQVMVESGEGGAQAAMDLHDNPTKFLSTVQIGITGIGVLNGIVGDAAFSGPLSHWLTETFHLNPHAAIAGRPEQEQTIVLAFLADAPELEQFDGRLFHRQAVQ